MKKNINTIIAFISWPLLFVGIDQSEWILSLSMATTLALSFMIEGELI